MPEQIIEYSYKYKRDVEEFKEKAISEGNDSLKKLNIDELDGVLFLHFKDNTLISIMAVENSMLYTGESDSCRMCRYHILREYRHSNSGFKMLPHQVNWAKENGYKVIYWTHDVKNKAMNALYQHKKKYPFAESGKEYFDTDLYNSFNLIPNVVFKVSKTDPLLQFIYAKILVDDFVWEPTLNIITIPHNGELQ
jgi:Acetyltransferase (GNAT) family